MPTTALTAELPGGLGYLLLAGSVESTARTAADRRGAATADDVERAATARGRSLVREPAGRRAGDVMSATPAGAVSA